MKKTIRRGYVVNTAVLVAVYILCVVLANVFSEVSNFKLILTPSI